MSIGMLRRYFAEFIGTFALVFFGCGTRDMVGDTNIFGGILVVHLAFGFTVAVMIYTLGHISAAVLNPALTFGFALSGRFPWKCVLPYWVAQFAGALLAVFMHFLIVPEKASAAHFGATIPKVGIVAAIVVEIVLTFFLMLVNMASATDKRFRRSESGLAVGFTILVSGLLANSLSGGSMNPARSLAPAVFAGGEALTTLWIYFVGPLIGAALAVLAYEFVRGNKEHMKDVLEDLPNMDEVLSRLKRDPQQEGLQDAVKQIH